MSRGISSPAEEPHLLIGALLRVPAHAIHRRLIAELNGAGFRGLTLPHMAVLQYPGPDGHRPIELAERANTSKQAMNQLLQSLERLGYIRRAHAEDGGRPVLVHFTDRGAAVWEKILEILEAIEDEWQAALGASKFNELKSILEEVYVSDLVK